MSDKKLFHNQVRFLFSAFIQRTVNIMCLTEVVLFGAITNPLIYETASTCWIFTDEFFEANGWLALYRESEYDDDFSEMANEYWGDSLQYLKHIYYHFELVAPGFNTRWLLDTNNPLFSAVERGYIKAFKLDKGKIFRSSLEISVDSHPIWSQYLQSHFPEGSINQLRAELACALSESLDGRWYDRDAENRMLYSSGFGTRMKLRVEHTAQGAVDYVVDSVKELIDIGLVLFEGAKAGCRAYLALRKEIDERGAIAITERMHALGIKIEQSVERITALIKKGVDILNVILSDPFCQNHILEYFDGLKESISELGYCRMIGGFVGELGLDFIIALATGGQGLVLRAAQLIGGLSSKVLKVMLKLYDTLQEKAAKVLEARMLDLYGEHAFDMLKAPVVPTKQQYPQIERQKNSGKIEKPKQKLNLDKLKKDKPEKKEISKPVVQLTAGVASGKRGVKGSWDTELENPKPNTVYEVTSIHNGQPAKYIYETDELGRTIRVKGKLQLSSIEKNKERDKLHRNDKTQSAYGGPDPEYDGGHLIATLFQGPAEKINLVPQLKEQNRYGPWRKMESKWAKKLKKDKSAEIYIAINIVYDNAENAPELFVVDSVINGKVQKTLRFSNRI